MEWDKKLKQCLSTRDVLGSMILLESMQDINLLGISGYAPIHIVVKADSLPLTQELISRGARTTVMCSEKRRTPLHYVCAASGRKADIPMLLIQHGADVSARDAAQFTPLQLASAYGNLEIVKLLLEFGAKPNASMDNINKYTPLMHAVCTGMYSVVETLLDAGARVDVVNSSGVTAIHLAAKTGRVDMINLLIAAGADPMVVDEDGLYPHDYACTENVYDALTG